MSPLNGGSEFMRIAAMAAGAVGGYFGARMAAAGHDVFFIARGAHRDAIAKNGLKVESVLADDSFDVVILHQVLHFLDDGARAIHEAARVLRPGGRLLIVDFAPHEQEFLREQFAHRRLGFAPETVTQWMTASGLEAVLHKSLAPDHGSEGKIAVSLWLARDTRVLIAAPQRREVA
jgi:SAM-dependent methyltransferase